MSAALGIVLRPEGARLAVNLTPPDPLPVAAMLLGRPPEEVAVMLPRLFNLCGAAQGHAARLALGLAVEAAPARREILRDHLAKLCLIWPKLLGLRPQPLPDHWAEGGPALQDWLWGGEKPGDLWQFLISGRGVAPLLATLGHAFAPGEAVAVLPPLFDPMALTAQENSPAGRVADEPWAFWDFLPTAAELAHTSMPNDLTTDGLSLVSFLKGGSAPTREAFYWELHEGKPSQAVRFGSWKAVRNGPRATIDLYDLASDPGESHNLALQQPGVVARAVQIMQSSHRDDPNWPLF